MPFPAIDLRKHNDHGDEFMNDDKNDLAYSFFSYPNQSEQVQGPGEIDINLFPQ